MRVTEFLEGRNVERQAVTRYINRHGEIFKGHTKKVGKELDLDSVAVEELAKVYPFPKPVIIQQGVPQEEHDRLKDKLIASQEMVNDLHKQLLEAQKQIATAEASRLLLEDSKKRIADLEEKQAEKDAEIKILQETKDAEIKELQEAREQEIKALQEELAKERSRTWLQRLLGK